MAKARQLISGATYDPTTLNMLDQAFEDAWSDIAGNYQSSLAIEAARLKLANVVLSVAAEGERDPKTLKDRAVRIMSIDAP
jgi:hypothetical protein